MAIVLTWTVAVAIATAVATGAFGDLGMPTDGDGRPRGLLVVGASALVAATGVGIVYRRIREPVSDLLHAAEQVATGDLAPAPVEVRGFRELRLLTEGFNAMVERLTQSQERRRAFLADVTHELRNPLAVLQSGIEAQLYGVHPRDDRRLLSLLEEAERLGLLVTDLHTLALSESGELVLRHESVALGALVEEAVRRHDDRAGRRGVTLRSEIEADVPPARIDQRRIRQVIDNLLGNAIRHTATGGDVVIEVSTTSRSPADAIVVCQVTDAGLGFPEDRLPFVFERFSRDGSSGGSGLGLAIARDLVRAHGGTMWAANADTGGASVAFTLPVLDGETTRGRSTNAAAGVEPGRTGRARYTER